MTEPSAAEFYRMTQEAKEQRERADSLQADLASARERAARADRMKAALLAVADQHPDLIVVDPRGYPGDTERLFTRQRLLLDFVTDILAADRPLTARPGPPDGGERED